MAGVMTISVFLVRIHLARGGWEGDGGLRSGSGGELDSAQTSGPPDLGLPPIQRGNCPDGAEPGGVWNLAVWAQHPLPPPPPASLPPLGDQPCWGWTPAPPCPAHLSWSGSHLLQPCLCPPRLCQPLKGFPWSSFCPQDWSESLIASSPPKPPTWGKEAEAEEPGHGSRGSVGPCRVWVLF